MGIKADIQSLSPSSLIELFVLDLSITTSGGELFFHAGTNQLSQPIIWQGQKYNPWPVTASGFDKSGQGTLPRPKIQISNFGGMVSAEVQGNDDLVGCKIIRKLTLARFLDAENFENGNPAADPQQHFPDEIWFVEQKVLETHEVVEFELSSVFDLMGVQLPYRQIIKNSCPWKYRGPECGYTGPYFDKSNNPTSMSGDDFCAKRYDSCYARRDYFADGIIHYGGFIGATRYE
ncbi:phage minor tail protein L [Escherichia coli]|nr:phage minor tail protein L [Escherichia coli]HAX2345264.1 phage minor tail protein L [Escherichia coli]HBN7237006.1 phage minor tail protein L [Escherichia coli]HBN7443541.1 phage minor tail protein L [Escherichia coli]HBQ4879980.1 phage minor tail protein L [Escherichia coli]